MNWTAIIENPWIGFAGTLFGVLGIIASIVFYFRTRKYQQPAYYQSSIRWYDGANVPHKDVQLTFRGRTIPRFTITHLLFWNAGNQFIRESDFAPASQLSLEIPEGVEVFDIRLTAVTANAIRVYLETEEAIEAGERRSIPVHFDYLDGDDGFSVQLIHDAKSSAGFRFSGKLPGVSEFKSTTSYSRERGLISPLGYGPSLQYNSPMFRFLFTPLLSLGLGGIGIWSIYWAIFREFHWYQVFGWLMVFYLFMPFIVFLEINPPKALAEAVIERAEKPNK